MGAGLGLSVGVGWGRGGGFGDVAARMWTLGGGVFVQRFSEKHLLAPHHQPLHRMSYCHFAVYNDARVVVPAPFRPPAPPTHAQARVYQGNRARIRVGQL